MTSTTAAPAVRTADGTGTSTGATGGSEVALDRRLERLGAVSGLAFVGFAAAAYLIARFIPVKSPSTSPAVLAAFVTAHRFEVLIGMGLLLVGGFTFLLTWSITFAYQVRKYANPSPLVFLVQVSVGLIGAIIAMLSGVIGTALAYRVAELPPATVQLLYDLVWFLFLLPWPPFMLWQLLAGFAILSPTNDERCFPRWTGYLSLWASALEFFSFLSPFFVRGPFSYNGAVSFWVPGVSFFAWVFVLTVVQLRAAGRIAATSFGRDVRPRA